MTSGDKNGEKGESPKPNRQISIWIQDLESEDLEEEIDFSRGFSTFTQALACVKMT